MAPLVFPAAASATIRSNISVSSPFHTTHDVLLGKKLQTRLFTSCFIESIQKTDNETNDIRRWCDGGGVKVKVGRTTTLCWRLLDDQPAVRWLLEPLREQNSAPERSSNLWDNLNAQLGD